MKKYDYIIYIGRFQPFHNGHKQNIELALENAEQVIVLIGSATRASSVKNPFSFYQRAAMIEDEFLELTAQKCLQVLSIEDYKYNEAKWLEGVQKAVSFTKGKKVALLTHHKDESTYYLNSFPQWETFEVPSYMAGATSKTTLDATKIRELYFEGHSKFLKAIVPNSSYNFLNDFSEKESYGELCAEYNFIKDYQEQWKGTPYPVIFNTVDAVVFQSGHVLMVTRGAQPGKGLLALPGGFINPKETLLGAAIRELREETRLKVPEPVLCGSIVGKEIFDDPNRSERGRTITTAFCFKLADGFGLPKVKGSDDACYAQWIPLADVMNMKGQIYEDHWDIIDYFKGLI